VELLEILHDVPAHLENDLGGYPKMDVPGGEKWLADMVRAGAKRRTSTTKR
jgi:hypothetical protein